ncbi:histone-binding protein RBBP4 [Mucor circinelloides 1006PhL]|uniref:Histone-binding protein RBBP4 n=1 Tax=Mucor circinelloides f. circinelloides (strain 1006PhL) TaxID=1220926 RepID=S2JA12_MUCC1|nr:histone-binding protein RBBP4 [Mucor circinelloides 1006PhL]
MDYELENKTEEENEKLINEEYKMWKKNSPFLYDLVVTHALEWPSLTCQWFPTVEEVPDKNYKIQNLLLGTHTNDNEPNYLQIASVRLPNEVKKSEDTVMEDASEDEKDNETFIKITQKILHDGEVNRARYQIENPDIIATKSRTGDVYVFDRTTFDPMPKEGEKFNPTLRLTGHDKEGYGLAWSPHKGNSTHLLSAGFDSKICQWDIAGTTKENRELEPVRTYTAHTTGVEDVAWHTKFESIFASVGDDARLMIWDARNDSNKPIHNIQAHEAEINCVAFAPGSEWILATGSGDKTAALWDLRNLKQPIHSLRAHQSEILQLAWSPHHDAVLATASSDRRILVWDLSKIDAPQLPEEAEDGPPELLFMHGGHTNKISDFGWNPADPWVLSSTADDNIVQVWQMASNIYNPQSHYHHQEHTAPPATDDLLDSKSKNENESQASSVAANTAPTTPGSVSNTLNESTATAAPTSTAADDDQVNLNAVDDKETPSVTPAKTAEPSDATSTTQQGSTAENLNNDGDVQMQD